MSASGFSKAAGLAECSVSWKQAASAHRLCTDIQQMPAVFDFGCFSGCSACMMLVDPAYMRNMKKHII